MNETQWFLKGTSTSSESCGLIQFQAKNITRALYASNPPKRKGCLWERGHK